MEQAPVAGIDVAIGVLLKRQVHIQANAALAARAAVRRLHDAAAGPRHHFKAAPGRFAGELLGQRISRLLRLGSGGPKHGHLAGLAMGGKDVEAIADVRQGTGDQSPLIGITAIACDLQQLNHTALDGAALGMALKGIGQRVQGASLDRHRLGSGQKSPAKGRA